MVLHTLGIDLETYSSVDLKKGGVHKYVNSSDFKILLIAASYDGAEPEIYDLANGEVPPGKFFRWLENNAVLKTAWNAAFELACLHKYYPQQIKTNQWQCTMVLAAYLGLPLSLDNAGAVLHLPIQKDKLGKALIKFFCVPRKATKNNDAIRNLPKDDWEKWQQFKKYCVTDVIVEQQIRQHLIKRVTVIDFETELWALDQRINNRGVCVDIEFVKNAVAIDHFTRTRLMAEARKLTGLENPNSVAQLKAWLEEAIGLDSIDTLNKKALPGLLDQCDDEDTARVIEIRQQLSKSSVKKYQAIMNGVDDVDGRLRGMFQYYGAMRTGRWAGRRVQLHNLIKNNMYHHNGIDELNIARKFVKAGDLDTLDLLFGEDATQNILSQLIRTSFIPQEGKKFIVSDFSAIEARVIAWFAQENWRLNVFATHGKIYEASASMMFKIAMELITKNSDYRFKGKIAELALGYQGGVNAMIRMGAEEMGLTVTEMEDIVKKWRRANPNIVSLWNTINNCAINAYADGTIERFRGLSFFVRDNVFYIQLPSGRCLHYYNPKLKETPYGHQLTYEGIDQYTGKWNRQSTYGGKLVENIVQATARDLLAVKMVDGEKAGHPIVIHVHDEIVFEVNQQVQISEINKIMDKPVPWAKGLPLKGDSFETLYYRKD